MVRTVDRTALASDDLAPGDLADFYDEDGSNPTTFEFLTYTRGLDGVRVEWWAPVGHDRGGRYLRNVYLYRPHE